MPTQQQVRIGERTLRVSNLDKVLYPAAGTTKADVLRYYVEVAEVMLPHLADRPVTFRRYPDGVESEGFYQKRCPDHRPSWLGTLALSRSTEGDEVDHCHLADAAALAWSANLGALELHVPMARAPHTSNPTAVVFDLDPGAPADVLDCAWVALRIRDLLEELGLTSVVKTSGSKGLQVYLPIDPTGVTYDDTRGFAEAVARGLEAQRPDRVVSAQRKSIRPGKVLLDWLQNHVIKTTVCAYSLRARDRPTASTPVTWEEVEAAHDEGRSAALRFEIDDVLDRVATHGDHFAAALDGTQSLPPIRGG